MVPINGIAFVGHSQVNQFQLLNTIIMFDYIPKKIDQKILIMKKKKHMKIPILMKLFHNHQRNFPLKRKQFMLIGINKKMTFFLKRCKNMDTKSIKSSNISQTNKKIVFVFVINNFALVKQNQQLVLCQLKLLNQDKSLLMMMKILFQHFHVH